MPSMQGAAGRSAEDRASY